MKFVVVTLLMLTSLHCLGMETGEVTLNFQRTDYTSVHPTVWAEQAVTCIVKRKSTKLETLLAHPPSTRSNKTPTDYLIEKLQVEKQECHETLNSSSWKGKRLQNKLWAIFMDLGLPITGGAFGLTEGIMAKEPLLIFFGAYFLVSSTITGIREAIDHWTMAEYEDRITALDINLLLLQHTQNSNQGGDNSSDEQGDGERH